MTQELHLEVHPCGAAELLVDPLPDGAKREGALYPDGAHITNLKEVRDLLYKMQRPGIAPPVSASCNDTLLVSLADIVVHVSSWSTRKIGKRSCIIDQYIPHRVLTFSSSGTREIWSSSTIGVYCTR